MTKVLRPVPTFDQLVNLPTPQLTPPERAIEVSRPDPNVFDFHEAQMGQQQAAATAVFKKAQNATRAMADQDEALRHREAALQAQGGPTFTEGAPPGREPGPVNTGGGKGGLQSARGELPEPPVVEVPAAAYVWPP